MAAFLCYYSVRFEGRKHGSIGRFLAILFDCQAASPAEAVEKARAELATKYELRFGGDWRYTDGSRIWSSLDGSEAPMLLPCQIETLQAGAR